MFIVLFRDRRQGKTFTLRVRIFHPFALGGVHFLHPADTEVVGGSQHPLYASLALLRRRLLAAYVPSRLKNTEDVLHSPLVEAAKLNEMFVTCEAAGLPVQRDDLAQYDLRAPFELRLREQPKLTREPDALKGAGQAHAGTPSRQIASSRNASRSSSRNTSASRAAANRAPFNSPPSGVQFAQQRVTGNRHRPILVCARPLPCFLDSHAASMFAARGGW